MGSMPRRMCDIKGLKEVTISAVDEDGTTVSFVLPVETPSCGSAAIDVTRLHALSGLFTLDPGFTSTSSCRSAITFIDGPRGSLLHRGYSIAELSKQSSFLEVCYLLLNGELPASSRRLRLFSAEVVKRMTVHERLRAFMTGFPDGAHPMAVMVGTVGALSAFYQRGGVREMCEASRALAAVRVVAKLPTIAAMCYRHSIGMPYVYPRRDLSYAANLLHMMFSSPLDCAATSRPPKAFEEAIDTFLLLHADHEQNASTSTVRLAGSSDANPFACVAAGIASLWGPMHGGANEACVNMLREIGTVERIPLFLARAKDKTDDFKLMGFGHRVYRNLDPRAAQMKRLALECIAEYETRNAENEDEDAYVTAPYPVGSAQQQQQEQQEPADLRALFKLAVQLEEAARKDEYFVQRKLFPNVDFYSGLALTAIGIPTSMFTCLFAVGRSVGWITQWKESIEEKNRKISRPQQLYVGHTERSYPDLASRDAADLASRNAADLASTNDLMRQTSPRLMRQTSHFTDLMRQTPATVNDEDSFGYFS